MPGKEYDLVVIGGGPGGYTAAIRGAQKGLKTVLVERGHLGGTCLNRGCVPTKSLLEDSLMISAVRNCAFLKGDLKISLKGLVERKNMVVEGSRNWVSAMLSGNGVTLMRGSASFAGPKTVRVTNPKGENEEINATNIILATGATAEYGPGLVPDGQRILSTEHALSIESVPRRLAVVGAGNRGVEFASIYSALGAKVALIEKEKSILPRVHWELADRYKRALTDRKIKVLSGCALEMIDARSEESVALTLATDKGQQEIRVDKVILTGVRRPSYEGLNLNAAGLRVSESALEFDADLQTSVKGIFVLGDAAGPPYFAHKAISQAIPLVDFIAGDKSSRQPLFFPTCVYGDPELASVGMTEDEAQDAGHEVKLGEFNFIGNGRSGTIGNSQGLVKIVSDSKTGVVLGAHIIGPQATELISLAALAMQNGVDVAGVKKTVFAHPTLSETFFEAALATDGEAIHLLANGE